MSRRTAPNLRRRPRRGPGVTAAAPQDVRLDVLRELSELAEPTPHTARQPGEATASLRAAELDAVEDQLPDSP